MNTNDGGPAFPSQGGANMPWHGSEIHWLGLSMRDYFAANVVGHIVGAVFADKETGLLMQRKPELAQGLLEGFSVVSYGVADAMLKARGTP